MTSSRVWVLNYDAELELAGAPTARVPRVARPSWIGSRDTVLDGTKRQRERTRVAGAAWCPTPKALSALRAAGAEPLPAAPDVAVLKAANSRESFADLHPLSAHGAVLVSTVEDAQRAIRRSAPARPSGRAPAWLLRRSLSAAGQGRLLVEQWTKEVDVWTERALRFGPLHVMPLVYIEEEFAAHGFLDRSGEVQLGVHVTQTVRGSAWQAAARRAAPIPAMEVALAAVLERLSSMGYFGPVGVDGFLWRDADGGQHLAAGTDVNARYSMSMGAAFDAVPSPDH